MKANTQKASKGKSLVLMLLMLSVLIGGCKKSVSKKSLAQIDTILIVNESKLLDATYLRKIDSTRKFVDNDDIIRLSQFYKIKQLHFQVKGNYTTANIYADSILNLFYNDKVISENKEAYFNALLGKGDAVYLSKKFSQAVLFYLEARSFRKKNLDICYTTALAVRIGNVYFVQSKFTQAASYYKESYELEIKCPKKTDEVKHFYDIQAQLNNTGYCYERAKMLDSAQYYYQKDLDYINSSRSNPKIPLYSLEDASATALDNLGSIYLKKGDLLTAEKLLLKSTSIRYSGGDDFKTPPLIKLANLYTLKGDLDRANRSFKSADSLLKIRPIPELLSRWHIARAEYYFKKSDFKSAYNEIRQHLVFKDTVNKDQAKLSSINIEKDFASLEQKYHLQDLEKKSAIQSIYLIFSASFLILVIIISFLLFRNSRQSKKNHLIIKLHNDELKEALLKLEEANRNYVRVMKIMAHDLRNPLSGISGVSGLLLNNSTIVKLEGESLALIKASADHATGMINEILNAMLNNDEHHKIEKEIFDIRILLYQCVSLLNFKAAEKKQKLIIKPVKKELTIKANKEKLWRVFNNIIVNAIKFSHDEAIIELGIEKLEQSVIISIADNGIGIPEEFKDKIFDMFTEAKRLGTSGEKPYGLGLSISKQIVEEHGGKLWFEANANGGTIFYIQLPY